MSNTTQEQRRNETTTTKEQTMDNTTQEMEIDRVVRILMKPYKISYGYTTPQTDPGLIVRQCSEWLHSQLDSDDHTVDGLVVKNIKFKPHSLVISWVMGVNDMDIVRFRTWSEINCDQDVSTHTRALKVQSI